MVHYRHVLQYFTYKNYTSTCYIYYENIWTRDLSILKVNHKLNELSTRYIFDSYDNNFKIMFCNWYGETKMLNHST